MTQRTTRMALIFLALPALALADPGGGAGSIAGGLAHPLAGADHVLAMVAVGLWAVQAGGAALWLFPSAFVTAMLAGGALGFAGVPLPAVEPVILASVIILGAAVALALRPPLPFALAAITIFGVAHGHAHGVEGPAVGILAYAQGFALATAFLHLAGIGLGRLLSRAASPAALRTLGALSAGAGVALSVTG